MGDDAAAGGGLLIGAAVAGGLRVEQDDRARFGAGVDDLVEVAALEPVDDTQVSGASDLKFETFEISDPRGPKSHNLTSRGQGDQLHPLQLDPLAFPASQGRFSR